MKKATPKKMTTKPMPWENSPLDKAIDKAAKGAMPKQKKPMPKGKVKK